MRHQHYDTSDKREKPVNIMYSIGYGNRESLPVLNRLMQSDYQLVDVRLTPYSNHPDYQQTALISRYHERYTHIPNLGNINHRSPDAPIQLKNATNGIKQLATILQQHNVIILCGCKVVEDCHRNVIAQLLNDAMDKKQIAQSVIIEL